MKKPFCFNVGFGEPYPETERKKKSQAYNFLSLWLCIALGLLSFVASKLSKLLYEIQPLTPLN